MSETKPPPPDPARQEKKRKLPKAAEPYKFKPGKSGNPKGRPTGAAQLHDAVLKFFFDDGVIEVKGERRKALEVFLQGLVIKSREDIEYARLTLELIAGKTAAAWGEFPGLGDGTSRTYIRRERLLEIFREAQGDGMKVIDVQTKTGEGGNGNGTGASH